MIGLYPQGGDQAVEHVIVKLFAGTELFPVAIKELAEKFLLTDLGENEMAGVGFPVDGRAFGQLAVVGIDAQFDIGLLCFDGLAITLLQGVVDNLEFAIGKVGYLAHGCLVCW